MLLLSRSERIVSFHWYRLSCYKCRTHALLDDLYVFLANADSSCTAEMPACFSFQVLDHDTRQHNHLRIDTIKDCVVR